jgi:hypothetical protein
MKALGPIVTQCIAIPIGLMAAELMRLAWHHTAGYPGQITLTTFWEFVLAMLLLIPAHEALHALAHPGCGFSPNTFIGIWPSRGLAYAFYAGRVSRGRKFAILAMPWLVISAVPLVLAFRFPQIGPVTMRVSIVNTFASCVDFWAILLVWWQTPAGCVMRGKGWKSYWQAGPTAS